MVDFTSALYLGLLHSSESLRPWGRLTTGVPAALRTPPGAAAVAARLAALQGAPRATLGSSTLHLFWDLHGLLSTRHGAVYVDAGAYPIARWGVERMAARGVPVTEFRHHDADALRCALRRAGRSRRPPLIVADGFCPACGAAAPLRAYLACARENGGRLAIDDTQALGVLGRSPGPGAPYGRGGGGSLPHASIAGADVLTVSSLAKGLGVPIAALAGSRAEVTRFESRSETRTHASPPSTADVHAAERALDLNDRSGDATRARLAALVRRFRRGVGALGLTPTGRLFPVQGLGGMSEESAGALHAALLGEGLRTVLHRDHLSPGARVSFVITAAHALPDVDHAVAALGRALAASSYQNYGRRLRLP